MVQLPHLAGHKSRTVSRLEDSATQTQVENIFLQREQGRNRGSIVEQNFN
jgi:hypothetical protein